jgi:arsenate reductase (glutaredoxin)
MKMHPNELFFYYNASHQGDKQARAYARSVSRYVNEINMEKEKITTTGWRTILDKLNLRPKDLLNRAHPDYQNQIAGKSWDDESWLHILVKFPHLIKAPIAIKRDKAILCTNPTDVLKLN